MEKSYTKKAISYDMAERARVSCVDRNHAMQKYNNKLNYKQKTI